MKRFLVHTVGWNKEKGSYLRVEEQWTPKLLAYLSSCAWLAGSGWEDFVEHAEVGQAFIFDGMISVVRLAGESTSSE